MLVPLLALLLVLAGCSQRGTGHGAETEFEPLALDATPVEVQQYYEEMKAVPGFFVLHLQGQTYLLLMAGAADEPGLMMTMTDLRKNGDEYRLLARVAPHETGSEYPYAVARMKVPVDARFVARVTDPTGEVLDLQGMVVTDR